MPARYLQFCILTNLREFLLFAQKVNLRCMVYFSVCIVLAILIDCFTFYDPLGFKLVSLFHAVLQLS